MRSTFPPSVARVLGLVGPGARVFVKGSYFAECERDREGHCLPSGRAAEGSSEQTATADFLSQLAPSNRPQTDEEIAAVQKFKQDAGKWAESLFSEADGPLAQPYGDDTFDEMRKKKLATMLGHIQEIVGKWSTPAMIDRIRKNLGGFTLYKNTHELTQLGRKSDPTFPEKGQCGGFFTWQQGERVGSLHLDGGFDGRPETAASIYAHEFGHVIDGTGQALSRDPEWQKAWSEEIDKTHDPLSRYARTDSAEGLAEYFRLLLTGQYRDARMDFPKCYAFMKSKGLV